MLKLVYTTSGMDDVNIHGEGLYAVRGSGVAVPIKANWSVTSTVRDIMAQGTIAAYHGLSSI
ncbi:MAG: hypothetical protein WA323_27580 [Candidatus Nitrosopolaris sp.]